MLKFALWMITEGIIGLGTAGLVYWEWDEMEEGVGQLLTVLITVLGGVGCGLVVYGMFYVWDIQW